MAELLSPGTIETNVHVPTSKRAMDAAQSQMRRRERFNGHIAALWPCSSSFILCSMQRAKLPKYPSGTLKGLLLVLSR